jgi:hypothetical protein
VPIRPKPRTLASTPSNPERKNTPCISDLAGVKFLLKSEKGTGVFSFGALSSKNSVSAAGRKYERNSSRVKMEWCEKENLLCAFRLQ